VGAIELGLSPLLQVAYIFFQPLLPLNRESQVRS
jgi:hypothetical protein